MPHGGQPAQRSMAPRIRSWFHQPKSKDTTRTQERSNVVLVYAALLGLAVSAGFGWHAYRNRNARRVSLAPVVELALHPTSPRRSPTGQVVVPRTSAPPALPGMSNGYLAPSPTAPSPAPTVSPRRPVAPVGASPDAAAQPGALRVPAQRTRHSPYAAPLIQNSRITLPDDDTPELDLGFRSVATDRETIFQAGDIAESMSVTGPDGRIRLGGAS